METCRFAGSWCGGAPFTFDQHPVLLVIFDLALAVLADVDGFFGFALGPADLREFQHLILVAVRARDPVIALIAVFKARFNTAAAGDLRSRDHEHFSPRESARPRQRQVHRVAFTIHIAWICIHFIEEQINGRPWNEVRQRCFAPPRPSPLTI